MSCIRDLYDLDDKQTFNKKRENHKKNDSTFLRSQGGEQLQNIP